MAEGKTWVKQLQENIEMLNDAYDIVAVEKQLLESEIQDTKSASQLLNRQNSILITMLEEVYEYHKNKPSERTKASLERLMKLCDINSKLETKVYINVNLQRANLEFFGRIQLLRIENADLKRQIEQMTNATNF